MIKRILWSAGLTFVVTGCTSIDRTSGDGLWFNSSLPIHLQHSLYEQERDFCAQAADQWVPVPDVRFSFQGARYINGSPNVSVEGSSMSVSTSPVEQGLVTNAIGSNVGFWQTVAAATLRGRRETRDEERCMSALGWQATNDTWDGTPSRLNETIAINKAVMDSVARGYSHPMLGSGAMALINIRQSRLVNGKYVLHTSEIPLYAPDRTTLCIYELESSWLSSHGVVSCNGGQKTPIGISASSPIAHWIDRYF